MTYTRSLTNDADAGMSTMSYAREHDTDGAAHENMNTCEHEDLLTIVPYIFRPETKRSDMRTIVIAWLQRMKTLAPHPNRMMVGSDLSTTAMSKWGPNAPHRAMLPNAWQCKWSIRCDHEDPSRQCRTDMRMTTIHTTTNRFQLAYILSMCSMHRMPFS